MNTKPNFTNLFQKAKQVSGDENLQARAKVMSDVRNHHWHDQNGFLPKSSMPVGQVTKPDFNNLFEQVKQAEATHHKMDRVSLVRTLQHSQHFAAFRTEVKALPQNEREAWLNAISEVSA